MSHRYLKLFADEPEKARTFPSPVEPSPDEVGVGWKLRYAPDALTREDHLYLASIVSAYGYLVCEMTARDRQSVVSEMRRIMETQSDTQPLGSSHRS
jgi:hypothetical protein